MFGLVHVTRYQILLRMLANATMLEVGIIADDEVRVLALREIGRGVDTLLHVDMLYFF
jgi:hypothetical protein